MSKSRNKWDLRFMNMALLVASWSKDTTKVGAVIVDNDKIMSLLAITVFQEDAMTQLKKGALSQSSTYMLNTLRGTLYITPFDTVNQLLDVHCILPYFRVQNVLEQ